MINLSVMGVAEGIETSLKSIVEMVFNYRVDREPQPGVDAPTGEHYKAFCAGGQLTEEQERDGNWPMLFQFPEDAIARFIEDIYRHSYDHTGVLYWSVVPVLEQIRQGNRLYYQVYSMFLVSELPVLEIEQPPPQFERHVNVNGMNINGVNFPGVMQNIVIRPMGNHEVDAMALDEQQRQQAIDELQIGAQELDEVMRNHDGQP